MYSTFQELASSEIAPGTINVIEAPGNEHLLLGMNADGDSLVLFLDDGESRPSRKLESIAIDYGRNFTVTKKGERITNKYSSIRLYKRNSHLLESFCLVVGALVKNNQIAGDTFSIRVTIDEFVKLFERRSGDLRDRVKGLFGELLLINLAANKNDWVDAWHVEANSNKDFSFSNFYVEVKTTESKTRSHRVGLSQILSNNKPIYIASVALLEDAAGSTVLELLEKLMKSVEDVERQSKIVRLFYDVIGNQGSEAAELRFVTGESGPEVIFLESSELPRPSATEGPFAEAVTEVNFTFSVVKLLELGFQAEIDWPTGIVH